MTEGLKRIFRAETAQEARQKAHALMEEMENAAPKAVACLEEGLEDALAVMALPEKYRRRLIGALLAEIHEDWQDRRYLDMSEFNEWWEAQQASERKTDKVVGIDH